MSSEKVDIARRGIDAFNGGDVEALAAETTADFWGRGKGSRVPVEASNAIVMDFRGAKVWRIHSYFDQAEAQDVALEGMSRKHVEVVLRWLLAFGSDRDAFSAVTHPEIEWMPSEEGHIPSRGLDAALRLRDRWLGVWEERITIKEIWGRGDDVFLAATLVGRRKASGAEVEARFYGHCRVRDDKVSYCYEHLSRDQAVKAVGVEE